MSRLECVARYESFRSALKTLTFAVTHFSVAFTVVYLLTGDLLIGSLVAMVEPAINTAAYFIHELAWQRFGGGRNELTPLGSTANP